MKQSLTKNQWKKKKQNNFVRTLFSLSLGTNAVTVYKAAALAPVAATVICCLFHYY